MFDGIINGWNLIKESIKIFNRYPKFIIPLLVTWVFYAPLVLYLKYWVNWEAYSLTVVVLIVFATICVFAFLLAFSCSVLLELIQQLENGKKMDIAEAFMSTIEQNIIKMLPLIFVWAIIWFVLTIIQALLTKRNNDDKEPATAENAAKTLAGYQSFSLSHAFFEALKKGVRMIIFLILPAIAWENMNFIQATKKGIATFKAHLSEFTTGFVLTEGVAGIIFFPPALLMYSSSELGFIYPEYVWYLVIIYIAFAWSYTMYLEQMFTAQLYLWNLKWEKEVAKAKKQGKSLPKMRDIPKPTVLDEVPELLAKK